jgi:hypothetical protein
MLNLAIVILKLLRYNEKILAVRVAKIDELMDKKYSLEKHLARYQESIGGYQVKAKYFQGRVAKLKSKLIGSEGDCRIRLLKDIQVSKNQLDDHRKDAYRAGNTIALQSCRTIV